MTSISIPAGVESLGGSCFRNCTALTEVTFAGTPSVSSFGFRCFETSGLTSISIPAGVESLGGRCFYNCTALTGVTFAGAPSVLSFGTQCFMASGLTSISIPASVTSIAERDWRGNAPLWPGGGDQAGKCRRDKGIGAESPACPGMGAGSAIMEIFVFFRIFCGEWSILRV